MAKRMSSARILPLIVSLVIAGLVGHPLLTAAGPAPEPLRAECPAAAQIFGLAEAGACAVHTGWQAPGVSRMGQPLALILPMVARPRLQATPAPLLNLLRPPVFLPA